MTTSIMRCTEQPPDWLTLTRQDRLTARGIRRFRHENRLSVATAAELFGYSAGYLSRIERGMRLPPDPGIAAAALGVTAAELLARCPRCDYDPPTGYTCQRCGSETPFTA